MNYMPGTASLIEEIDKKQLVVLRDGRILIGYLRSVDQFANLVLQNTVERIHVDSMYGDIPRGVFVVRGENVVLLGEVDLDNEERKDLEKVPIQTILAAQAKAQQEKQDKERAKAKIMKERGLIPSVDQNEDAF
uniref:U6 snRNA-associated Sm-like protein LSm1 n=1 Tax=Phallusia mammillata TaxID=59560 RepID=A0A6F9DKQ1_9ASCI|nr:U6 snRNA-associated Sm-like protein LSm1 [Phallusia mammillata]